MGRPLSCPAAAEAVRTVLPPMRGSCEGGILFSLKSITRYTSRSTAPGEQQRNRRGPHDATRARLCCGLVASRDGASVSECRPCGRAEGRPRRAQASRGLPGPLQAAAGGERQRAACCCQASERQRASIIRAAARPPLPLGRRQAALPVYPRHLWPGKPGTLQISR